ncbi:MAG: phosphotransferase [Gammaproteobacteria bacterium]|nr:phosphotransferase [Gammaproteobacteria bacterium]
MDDRLQALRTWLAKALATSTYELEPASADASFRRYFRVRVGDRSYIAMDAPPAQSDLTPYLRVAARFHDLGLNVPKVFESNTEMGFLLITDLGERLYLSQLDDTTVERLYGDALGALLILQAGVYSDSTFLPDYDETLLVDEMELFQEWYLGRHLGITLTAKQKAHLYHVFGQLTQSALDQPQVWVHRDFHSRNLLVTKHNNPGILDFQDAVLGPVTYDLVSLLRDCYIAWPRERVEDWAKGYHALALQSGIQVGEDDGQFLQWFDRMGLQRHLKAIGIFARLKYRDSKSGYLADIPRTLGYVIQVSARHADLQALNTLLYELGVAKAANREMT